MRVFSLGGVCYLIPVFFDDTPSVTILLFSAFELRRILLGGTHLCERELGILDQSHPPSEVSFHELFSHGTARRPLGRMI